MSLINRAIYISQSGDHILLKYNAGTVNRLDQESNLEVPEVRKLFVCIWCIMEYLVSIYFRFYWSIMLALSTV